MRQIVEQIEEGARRIVADLADVPYMSSSGLGALMAAEKHGRQRGVAISLAALDPNVRGIFMATKLTKLFRLFDTVEEALAAR
jgi:anti-anti-sigma factor